MNDETSESDETSGAALAQRARSRMAARSRLPRWYAAALGLIMLVVLFFLPVGALTRWSWMAPSSWPAQLPQWLILVAVALGFLVSRVQGADFRRTLMAYPSARLSGFLALGVFCVGELADVELTSHGLPVAAIAVAVVVAVATPVLMGRHYAAVRRDIRDGRVDPRWK